MPLTRLVAKNRGPATQTTTIVEPAAPVRIKGKVKALATQTVTITETSLVRLASKIRTRPETVAISENAARLCSKMRPLSTQTTTIDVGTAAIVKGKLRVLATQTVTIVETTLVRLAAKSRPLATQTVTISENRARLATKIRALALQIVAISESVSRTVAIQPKNIVKTLATETVVVAAGTAARLSAKSRALAVQTVTIGENLARLLTKLRVLALQTVSLSDLAAVIKTTGAQNIVRAVPTQTVAISDSLVRLAAKIRALTTQIVTISEQTTPSRGKFRAIPTQIVTIGTDAVTRVKTSAGAIVRSLSDSVAIAEVSLTRLATKTRTLSTQITSISENLARLRSKIRAIPAQTVTIGTGTTAITLRQKIRSIAQSITIPELLEAFKNGIKLVAPQAPDKGGSGKMALYPKGPRLKQIKYPVYIVSERRRLERRRRLRERQESVLIPAFKYNINKTVAPFVVINPIKHTVNVHFALKNSQNVRFAGKTIPVQIPISQSRKKVHKAKSTFVMNQKAITRYGRKLNKIQKVMTLFLLATTGADEAGL